MKFDNTVLDECPRCQMGRLRWVQRPYVELVCGRLLTVPDAISHCCDACDYYEYDEALLLLVNQMVERAIVTDNPQQHGAHWRLATTSGDDDLTRSPITDTQ